jgi:hypothetical protein
MLIDRQNIEYLNKHLSHQSRSKIQMIKSHDYSASRQRNEDITSQTRNNKHVQRTIIFLLLKGSYYL